MCRKGSMGGGHSSNFWWLTPLHWRLCQFLSRLARIVEYNHLIPDLQFGFRRKYSTTDQVHRVTEVIDKPLEGKLFCPSVFLDVGQGFDRVWHHGLIHKLRQLLPGAFYAVIQSYLKDWELVQFITTPLPRPPAISMPESLKAVHSVLYSIFCTRATDLAKRHDSNVRQRYGCTLHPSAV